MEGASELTVISDCICVDSLPSQYSAHESFFLFSANKPIQGRELQYLSAPEMRRRLALATLVIVCLVVRCLAWLF